MKTTEIVKNIAVLTVEQRIEIIENLLQPVKDDVFKQTVSNDFPIQKGDKTLNPTELFGIWENNPLSLQDIRKQDWQRNWNL